MAKKPDPSTGTETVPKKRKGSVVLVWVLMAMLVAGLGGFGVTNFGGGTASIATVGGPMPSLATALTSRFRP